MQKPWGTNMRRFFYPPRPDQQRRNWYESATTTRLFMLPKKAREAPGLLCVVRSVSTVLEPPEAGAEQTNNLSPHQSSVPLLV